MKTVYQCDNNGVFIGIEIARESPLESGVLMIPAGCVETSPPDVPKGYLARFSNNGWTLEVSPISSSSKTDDGESGESNPPDTVQMGRDWISRFYPVDILLLCKTWMDLLPHEATPKLMSLFSWTGSVTFAALDGAMEFPAPKVSFLDVATECRPLLEGGK